MNLTFKGAAKRLDDIDLPTLGARIGVGEDEIHAFLDVETTGSGFDNQGRPAMLFEPHVFYRNLSGEKRKQAVAAGLAYAKWGEKPYPRDSYPRLKAACAIDETAACKAASWGLGQVLGENFKAAGFPTVQAMVEAMMEDEERQLAAAVNFIKANKLDAALRKHDWAAFAKGYNGAGYKKNAYDTKLANAFAKWSRIKDTPFTQGPLPPTIAKDLPAAPAENATVTTVDGPKKDETTVIIAKTPQAPPASPGLPTSKTGFAAIAAIIIALITGAIKYFGG